MDPHAPPILFVLLLAAASTVPPVAATATEGAADAAGADLAILDLSVRKGAWPDGRWWTAPMQRTVFVHVANLGDETGMANLLVHVVGEDGGGWRVLFHDQVTLAPGEERLFFLPWDVTGTVGKINVYADVGVRDADGRNNFAHATEHVLAPVLGRGFILLNGHGFCVRPAGLGACQGVNLDDERMYVFASASVFVGGGAGVEERFDEDGIERVWVCAKAFLGPVPVRELHCEETRVG